MDELLNWIKENAKEDADISQAEKLVAGADEITPERAAELAKDKEMRRIIDAEISRAVESHDQKFRDEKLPKILEEERSKIRAEENPEETQEQKRIRELEERLQSADRERQSRERENELNKKAQELGAYDIGFTPDDVAKYASLGEQAVEAFEKVVNNINGTWTDSLDRKVKEKYSNGKPPQSGDNKGVEHMSVDEQMAYARRGDKERDEVMQYAQQKQKQGAN